MLRRQLLIVRRNWWLVALAVVVSVLVAALVTAIQPPVYRASMKIVVGQGRALFAPEFGSAVQPFTQTMTDLLRSEVVARDVIAALDLEETPDTLIDDLDVSNTPDASVLTVTYDHTDGEHAVEVLAAFGEGFTRLVDERVQPARDRRSGRAIAELPARASIFDPAHAEPDPVAPRPARNLAIATLLGLLVGLGLTLLREAFARPIRTRQDAQETFAAPVVGSLPPGVRGKPPPQLAGPLEAAHAKAAIDSWRLLRASVEFAGIGTEHRAIAVTSALPEEGKTSVVVGLAASLAAAGRSVLAVEGDIHRPDLHRFVGAETQAAGLCDLLDGRSSLGEVISPVQMAAATPSANGGGPASNHGRRRGGTNLFWLPAGQSRSDPARLLTGEKTADLIARARRLVDYVIFDTPPVLASGDAFPILQACDTVLVVARESRTTSDDADAVRETLDALGIKRFSVVLTDARSRERSGYSYAERLDAG